MITKKYDNQKTALISKGAARRLVEIQVMNNVV
jgi:hypothetical protein